MPIRVRLIQLLIHLNENIIFYPRLRRYYKKVLRNKNPVIMDVGVNKGQTIDFFLKLSPQAQFIGFEPNEKLFHFLKDKYRKHKNIQLFQKGISSQKGKLTFYENIMDETSTFESVNPDSEYLKNKAKILGVKNVEQMIVNQYEVEVVRIADVIRDQEIKKIGVLKIDAEGHEYHCLSGLFQEETDCRIDYIQLERHHDDMYRTEDRGIDALLQQNNYQLDAGIKHGFGGIEELIYKYTERSK